MRKKEVLYTNDKYDISGLGYSELKKKLISVSCTGHKGTIRHYFDKNEEAIRTKLEQKLEGYDINTTSEDKSEKYPYYLCWRRPHLWNLLYL